MNARHVRIVSASILAVGAAVIVALVTISADQRRADTAERAKVRDADRDAVREDVDELEARLKAYGASLGRSALPVRDEPVRPPVGVSENILTGTLAVGDFRDVFIDEGIVMRGLRAREVDEIRLTPLDNLSRTPQPPLKPKAGYRLVQVDVRFTNRSGDGADPGCGLTGSFNSVAFTDSGERALLLDSYDAVDTYPTACNAGLADGASGNFAFAVGMRAGDKLTALQIPYVGDRKSDSYTQVMVFEEPI